jgi:hypothetical protein
MSVGKKKGRMGRPPKPPGTVKGVMFCLRLTRSERARIDRAARSAGEDPSAWARAALLDLADRQLGR